MKGLLVITAITFIVPASLADESIIGTWRDKTEPNSYEYKFNNENDFVFTRKLTYKGETKSQVLKGVWEIGSWKITNSFGLTESCNLTIYAGTQECCFEYKFVANNLILENKYNPNNASYMCNNRVLIRGE